MKFLRNSFLVGLGLLLFLAQALAQGTTFTYQGRLADANAAANGLYDFQFKLYATANDSNVLGTVTVDDVNVTNGVFTVQLDFGAAPFANNAAQFLEICVRLGNQTGPYTTLTPRQRVNATPYAVKSMIANDALQLNGVAASQFVQTNDARLSDARTPTAGSGNYIQNGTALQAASNFHISGNGTAGGALSGNVVNAATQFNLGGSRSLAEVGENLVVGKDAGENLTSQVVNSTFVGRGAGRLTSGGVTNTFIGSAAGFNNTLGNHNVYVGSAAGESRTTESGNTLLGTFSKAAPGVNNATAIGFLAEVHQSDSLVLGTGTTSVGIGTSAPQARLHVAGNGLVTGDLTVQGTLNANLANLPAGSPNYIQNTTTQQTASNFNISGNGVIGGNLTVAGTLNANLPTGSGNYIQNGTSQQADSHFHISGNGTVGGTLLARVLHAQTQLDLNGVRMLFGISNNLFLGWGAGTSLLGGDNNSYFGFTAGAFGKNGSRNSYFGTAAGFHNESGNDNTFFGVNAGYDNLTGSNNVYVGSHAGFGNISAESTTFVGSAAKAAFANLVNATGLGAKAYAELNNTLVLGSVSGKNGATSSVNVGIGTTTPQARLHLKQDSITSGNPWGIQLENSLQATFRAGLRLTDSGFFEVTNNALAASPNFARLDGTGNWTVVSDRRLKTAIQPLQGVLANALKLRPVSFQYLQQSERHIGFIAQEVAEIFPSLVTNGDVNTLNYSGLSVVAIGAVQEQQQQLDELRAQNAALKAQVESLKQLVCAQHPTATACQK